MAIDKGKLQEEEEASAVTRFHKIILGWDYKQLAKENEVDKQLSPFPCGFSFNMLSNWNLLYM